jgi:hypothetical protein
MLSSEPPRSLVPRSGLPPLPLPQISMDRRTPPICLPVSKKRATLRTTYPQSIRRGGLPRGVPRLLPKKYLEAVIRARRWPSILISRFCLRRGPVAPSIPCLPKSHGIVLQNHNQFSSLSHNKKPVRPILVAAGVPAGHSAGWKACPRRLNAYTNS